MPINMSKYWNILNIIASFFLKYAFFCFWGTQKNTVLGFLVIGK